MDKSCSERIKKKLHKIIALLVSSTILLALYSRVDIAALKEIFRRFNYFYFLLILLSFVIIYLLVALRWKIMTKSYCQLPYFESVKLVAAASSLNVLLPSSMSSFTKAYFMTTKGYTETKSAISMVIYEKLSDMSAMSLIFILAAILNYKFNSLVILTLITSMFVLFFYASLHVINIFDNKFVWHLRKTKIIDKIVAFIEIIYIFNGNPHTSKPSLVKINSISFISWIVHVTQMVLFFYLLGLHVPVLTISTYMLCAVFVGLLPVSIAGLGTRDLTIVYLFKDIITYNEAIFIGILSASRYIIPNLMGLPFFIHLMLSKRDNTISKKSI